MTARAAILAVLVASSACSGRSPEFDGIGPWRFPHTTLKDITGGLCQPTDLSDGRKATWCFAQQPIRIGGSTAEVDLYFLGTELTARLIEIQLKVRGCHEDEIDQWLRSAFGPPIQTRPPPAPRQPVAPSMSDEGSRSYWKNSFLWAALMPKAARCLVRVLPLSENAEIDRIKQL